MRASRAPWRLRIAALTRLTGTIELGADLTLRHPLYKQKTRKL